MKPVEFKGTGNEYFNIWIVNILLCFVTLGIYYPWAKVRNRRYFYANTVYEGRNFEYHATGGQLFVGYAIGVGLLLAYSVINGVLPIIGVFLPILFFGAVPWVIWRSLKFNARMTSFSNVRFSFDGGLKQSYIIYLILPALGYILFISNTLGLITPSFIKDLIHNDFIEKLASNGFIIALVAFLSVIVTFVIYAFLLYLYASIQKKGIEYKIGCLRFGQGGFITNIKASFFVKLILKIGFFVFCIIISIIILGVLFTWIIGSNPIEIDDDLVKLLVPILALLYFGFIAISLFFRSYYYSNKRQYIYAHTQLDNIINFKSTVQTKPYFWIIFTNMLMVIFTLGMARPWAKVREVRYIANNTWIDSNETDIDNYLTQKQAEQSAIGEEVGDVFDVDVGIGL